MRINNVEVISFRVEVPWRLSRWGYPVQGDPVPRTQTITKISTDDGATGYSIGGDPNVMENVIKPLFVGEDALDRERLWVWMDQMVTSTPYLNERQMGIADCALWDLFGRTVNLPVYKIFGGARERVKAYASTHPNLGGPKIYADHALACKRHGYKAYKIHANIYWDPHNKRPAPQQPGYPKEDVAICRTVREAVGDEMVLMLDPFGVYTLEEALWVGHELEQLGFYWLEHPVIETRVETCRRLTRDLKIAILSPEHVPGGIFSRAEWVLSGASDMLRIDIGYGGITGCHKMVGVAQAYGIKCEMHGGGWAHNQILGSTTEATCEYYEHGLLGPGMDYPKRLPYLKSVPDPLDDDGNVILPKSPGLGMEFDWDYINGNLVQR
ncbi:MAG: enolase [Verrucomicrobia bacterium]|nr:enolase [Verrucomicrobiota bacterium]